MDNKQLKFSFTVDEASLQKTRALIRELTADLTKLNEAGAKLGGAGGGPGGGIFNVSSGQRQSPEQQKIVSNVAPAGRQLVQGLLDQKQVFKTIADGSKDSMRVMTDALKRAVSDQQSEVRRLQGALDALASTYQRLGGAAAGAVGAKIQDKFVQLTGRAQDARSRLSQLEGMGGTSEWLPDVPWPSAGGGGGRRGGPPPVSLASWSGYGDRPPGLFDPNDPNMTVGSVNRPGFGRRAAGIAGLAIGGAAVIQQEMMAEMKGEDALRAQRADLVSGRMAALLGGDVKLTWALRNMSAKQRTDMRGVLSSPAATVGQYMHGAQQAIGAGASMIPIIGPALGQALGSTGGPGGIAGGFTDIGRGNFSAAQGFAQAENVAKQNILENMAMDQFRGDLGARISAGRILGLGRSKDPKKGEFVDSFWNQKNQLQRKGYDISEDIAAGAQLKSAAGEQFGQKYRGLVRAANAMGLGGFGQVLGASARAGGGSAGALGFLGGGIDPWAGVQLGQSVLGQGFDPRGTTNGLGSLLAIQSGFQFTGGAGDFNTANRIAGGLKMGESLTTGSLDAYQKARNLVGAIDANPNLGIYGQGFLANGLSMKQMLDIGIGKGSTATTEALGISSDMVKKQLGGSLSSVIDRFRDTGANDPMSQTIRRYRAFRQQTGGDLSAFGATLSKDERQAAARNLGAFYNIQTGQGEEAALGLSGLTLGLSEAENAKLKKGSVGRGIGQTETAASEGLADAQQKLADTLKAMGSSFNDALKAIPEDLTKMANWAKTMENNAAEFMESLQQMTVVITESTRKIGLGAGVPVWTRPKGQ